MTDHDQPAEQALLGAITRSAGRALADLDDFDPADYFRPQHEELHRAVTAHTAQGHPVDEVTVGSMCAGIRGLDATYVLELTRACVSPTQAGYFAGVISRHATMRRAREVGTRLQTLDGGLVTQPDALDAALEDCRDGLANLGASRAATFTTFADIAERAIDAIGKTRYTPTPWQGLNHMIRGWAPACMYVLAARPGIGKTIVSVQAAIAAARRGQGSAYYTFEMSGERLFFRALAAQSGVDLGKILDGNLNETEWSAIARAQWSLSELPFVVEGSAGWTAQQVVAHAKATHRKRPLDFIVIDHIGRVAPGERRHSKEAETAEAANRFLDLAHQLDATVLVCSQLNRQPSQRSDPRPVATDIRDSDVLEQNADVVMLLHRDKEKTPDDLDLLVAKNRDGVDGPVELTFDGSHASVDDRAWNPHRALRSVKP